MKKVVKERKLILERDYFYPRLLREVRGEGVVEFSRNRVSGCNLLRFNCSLLNIKESGKWRWRWSVRARLLYSLSGQLYPNHDLKPLVKPLTFVGHNFEPSFVEISFPYFFFFFFASFYATRTFLSLVREIRFEKYTCIIYICRRKKLVYSVWRDTYSYYLRAIQQE